MSGETLPSGLAAMDMNPLILLRKYKIDRKLTECLNVHPTAEYGQPEVMLFKFLIYHHICSYVYNAVIYQVLKLKRCVHDHFEVQDVIAADKNEYLKSVVDYLKRETIEDVQYLENLVELDILHFEIAIWVHLGYNHHFGRQQLIKNSW